MKIIKSKRCFIIRVSKTPEISLYLYFQYPTQETKSLGQFNETHHRIRWFQFTKNFGIKYYRHFPKGDNKQDVDQPRVVRQPPKLRLVK